jgi:hypothetical protein
MRLQANALAILVGLVATPQWAVDSSAVVDIVPTTFDGSIYETHAKVELLSTSTQQDLWSQFHGLRGTAIPYGKYMLRVTIPGFRIHQQQLWVFQPHVYARVGLVLSRGVDQSPIGFLGVVSPPPKAGERLWAKLVPLLTSGTEMDALIGSDGRFEFAGMDTGQHLLMIVRGTKCIFTKQVDAEVSKIVVTIPGR